MSKLKFFALTFFALLALVHVAFPSESTQKLLTWETDHYRVAYHAKDSVVAAEVLRIAESVWPTLAKAYDSYDKYQRIDLVIMDDGDDANGFAIYNFSRVAIFAPHMDWVMRNRQLWLQNVVTHELAHIFSLRRAAYLSPVDQVNISGSTYDFTSNINYSFQIPWIPLVAPTWYIEGIAQFEAEQNGNDNWDSQRDMIIRDAYLTGTLPTLDFIETFERDESWTQAERCYNTGYAFLRYLKDRFGVEKVRDLAKPKPIFNFSYSVEKTFGKSLPDLFDDFKRSLADRYADFKDFPVDPIADKDMKGGYQQNLAFSPDGKYMAWIGNDENRRAPINWIYWKKITSDENPNVGEIFRTNQSLAQGLGEKAHGSATNPSYQQWEKPQALEPLQNNTGSFITPHLGNPMLGLARNLIHPKNSSLSSNSSSHSHRGLKNLSTIEEINRNDEPSSVGLEFNSASTKLLTTRQGDYARFTDIWEYDFKSNRDEDDKWHRLTWEERAAYPSYHPFKNLIVYTRKKAGSSNLALLDSTGRNLQLTKFTRGEQVYNPRFNPKGDSIYFTLGVLEKEAIVSISAEAAPYDPFLALKDSALFPDSCNIAINQKINFVTSFKKGGIRNLRFANDTLFWSANNEDSVYSVYDIYAKVPGDSAIYRATQTAGQALEALPHQGILYYQGYHKQNFQIFQQPLTLTRTQNYFTANSDSFPTIKSKAKDYSKNFAAGEYYGTMVALDITPYFSVQPQFISGDKSYTDLALGLSATFGEPYGSSMQDRAWSHTLGAAVTKRANLDDPLNYRLSYSGYLSSSPILYYSFYHDVVENTSTFHDQDILVDSTGTTLEFFTTKVQSEYTRDAISLFMPLPVNFSLDGNFWRQLVSQDIYSSVKTLNVNTGAQNSITAPPATQFKDAQQTRYLNTGLTWSFSKGAWGTYLPSGGGLYGTLHKWWAVYANGNSTEINATNAIGLSNQGEVVPDRVLIQSRYEPWSFDYGFSGVWSPGRTFSLFANAEMGAFLNKPPTVEVPTIINPGDTTLVENLDGGLWAMTYRIGYFKLGGYPYNFNYRGRDIMEGSSMAFGQYGIQIPIKAGNFLPGLPLTSFKQFMITGLGEWGTTLITAPDQIQNALDAGKHYLLLDFGIRLSMNFKLYHQIPFTIYAQAFMPYNQLSENKLYWDDYNHTGAPTNEELISNEQIINSPADRHDYIQRVKEPRFYIGFNLGNF